MLHGGWLQTLVAIAISIVLFALGLLPELRKSIFHPVRGWRQYRLRILENLSDVDRSPGVHMIAQALIIGRLPFTLMTVFEGGLLTLILLPWSYHSEFLRFIIRLLWMMIFAINGGTWLVVVVLVRTLTASDADVEIMKQKMELLKAQLK